MKKILWIIIIIGIMLGVGIWMFNTNENNNSNYQAQRSGIDSTNTLSTDVTQTSKNTETNL